MVFPNRRGSRLLPNTFFSVIKLIIFISYFSDNFNPYVYKLKDTGQNHSFPGFASGRTSPWMQTRPPSGHFASKALDFPLP